MTKAEIVQELLDKGYINAEKAVVLLTNEIQRGITYIPNIIQIHIGQQVQIGVQVIQCTPVFTTTNTFETNLNKKKKKMSNFKPLGDRVLVRPDSNNRRKEITRRIDSY